MEAELHQDFAFFQYALQARAKGDLSLSSILKLDGYLEKSGLKSCKGYTNLEV